MKKAIALAAVGTTAALVISAAPAQAASGHFPQQRQHRYETVLAGLECAKLGRHRAVYQILPSAPSAHGAWSNWRIVSATFGPCA